jgi:hypothetical protein
VVKLEWIAPMNATYMYIVVTQVSAFIGTLPMETSVMT